MRKRINILIFIFILFSSLVYFFDSSKTVLFFQDITQSILRTPKLVLHGISVAARQEENAELATLREENQMLVKKVADYESILQDNKALRSQFEESPIDSQELLPAKIVGYKGEYHMPHTLLIDRGERDGIKRGMAVISENSLVGVVFVTSPRYSTVLLPTNPDFRILARSLEKGTTGVVVGNDNTIVFDRVIVTDPLEVGDIIVTKGNMKDSEFGIVNDLIIGKVMSVKKEESIPFQSARLTSLLDFSKLETVFIHTGK